MPGKPRGKFSERKKGSNVSSAAESWMTDWKLTTVVGKMNTADDLDENSFSGMVMNQCQMGEWKTV